MSAKRVFAGVALTAAAILAGCGSQPSSTIEPARLSMFSPLPDAAVSEANPITDEKIALGRMLYYDARLSRDQKVSCNSCHDLTSYGVDAGPTSTGFKGAKGGRNAPTVYNAAGQFVQFWDGRAPNVEEQAKGPVMNPVEMAMPSEKAVLATLNSMPDYRKAFRKAFPADKDPVTFDNMGKAIGAFERRLLTPSRWDKFLGGDQAALTDAEKAGFNAFVDAGCPTCHVGALVGGNLYQKLGALEPWPDKSDQGRFEVTKNEADRLVFKVPTLRNIEKTGPYFHDGKTATLPEAVTAMGKHQLGKNLNRAQVAQIVTWLKSLTGPLPADYIKQPALPASTRQTPKPGTI